MMFLWFVLFQLESQFFFDAAFPWRIDFQLYGEEVRIQRNKSIDLRSIIPGMFLGTKKEVKLKY
jgi:hypothetical protein